MFTFIYIKFIYITNVYAANKLALYVTNGLPIGTFHPLPNGNLQ